MLADNEMPRPVLLKIEFCVIWLLTTPLPEISMPLPVLDEMTFLLNTLETLLFVTKMPGVLLLAIVLPLKRLLLEAFSTMAFMSPVADATGVVVVMVLPVIVQRVSFAVR